MTLPSPQITGMEAALALVAGAAVWWAWHWVETHWAETLLLFIGVVCARFAIAVWRLL